MQVDHLLDKSIFCCSKCFSQVKGDNTLIITDLSKENYECMCSELEYEIYSPTDCDICMDEKVSGCPMHLCYIKISKK